MFCTLHSHPTPQSQFCRILLRFACFCEQADPKVFSQHVPALNKHAPDCVRVLEKARTLFALDAKAGDEEAKAPPPPPPAKDKTVAKKGTPPPGRKRPPERVADSVTLAPSDPSDNEAGSGSEAEAAAPAAARPAAARPAATAGPSSSRKNGRQTQGAQKKRKGRAADEESSDEEQESMTSACSSSEEDEDDGEEDGVDADASERATSDDEDDGDAASSSSSVGAAKAPRKQKARAKKRRVEEPAPPPVSDATRMTAAEAMLAVKETALCSAMREIAAQSYEDVRAWRDGGRAPAMAEASACQVRTAAPTLARPRTTAHNRAQQTGRSTHAACRPRPMPGSGHLCSLVHLSLSRWPKTSATSSRPRRPRRSLRP